jgi:predicted nucleic acid-binding protein
MNYLLDTHVISETTRPQPNIRVRRWFKDLPSESLFISVLTLGEIRKGIEKLENGKRKSQLILWIEKELPYWFSENIIPIGREVAERWGYIKATMRQTLLINSNRYSSCCDSLNS